MHIPPFDNHNKPIVDAGNDRVPLNYFNIVKLKKGESFDYGDSLSEVLESKLVEIEKAVLQELVDLEQERVVHA